jgi:hypothetical protein
MSFLFLIEACAITSPNGAKQIRGKSIRLILLSRRVTCWLY